MSTLLIFYVVASLSLVALSIPLLLEKIPPNGLYGFRTQSTLGNPTIWYAVNKFAAKRLIVAGLSCAVAATGLYVLPGMSIDTYALGCLAVFGVVLGVGLWQSVRYVQSVTRQSV